MRVVVREENGGEDFTWCLCAWDGGFVGGPPAAAAVTLRSSEPEKDHAQVSI